jgi:WD40 repeat protein
MATGKAAGVLVGHAGWVNALAVAPDGSTLVSGGEDRQVCWWDISTAGREPPPRHIGQVNACSVSPSGAFVASGGRDGTVRSWDPSTGAQLAVGRQGAWIRTVASSADGSFVVTGGEDGSVRVWEGATLRERSAWPGHQGPVTACAVTPDGSSVLTSGEDGAMRLWDPTDGSLRAEVPGSGAWFLTCALAGDGSRAIAGCDDGAVVTWDLADAFERVGGGTGWVTAVAIAADGTWAVTGDDAGEVALLDLTGPASRRTLLAGAGRSDKVRAVRSCASSPDGRLVTCATGGGLELRVWAVPGGDEGVRVSTSWPRTASACAFLSDSRHVVTAHNDGALIVWDAHDGSQVSVLRAGAGLTCVQTAPGGVAIAGDIGGALHLYELVD